MVMVYLTPQVICYIPTCLRHFTTSCLVSRYNPKLNVKLPFEEENGFFASKNKRTINFAVKFFEEPPLIEVRVRA
jgi:hypothetical protein